MSETKVINNQECPLSFTEEAILQFKSALSSSKENAVRIGVKGGGCSGFMYNLELINIDTLDPEEDAVYCVSDVSFVIDCFSEPYLKNTKIDYLHSLRESGFKFLSSDVRRTCGCGSSFSK